MTEPITYLAFCEKIGVELTRAQRVIGAVSYDGAEPSWLTGKDWMVGQQVYGPISEVPAKARRVALNLCGGRGGKSFALTALRLLHLSLTVPLDRLAAGEIASALIVAPDMKLARQTFRFALGAAQHPSIANHIVGRPTKESFILEREHGRRVTVECLAATRGGSAVRARNYVGAGLDEFAFFRNEDFQVNDGDIYRAVTPRVLPGGQTMICSTAWARMGMMYDLFRDNWGKPETCLALKAPTVLLNPSKREDVALERKRDAANAEREFDCVFMDSSGVTFFSHDAIEAAIDESLPERMKPPPGCEVMIGADLGFRRDSSAIVAVYKLHDGTYVVAEILEMRPAPGRPLRPSEVVGTFALFCKRHECTWLMADGHYRETLEEELAKEKLSYVEAPTGAEGKATCHMHAKNILHSGKLRIPKNARLIGQMKSLIGRPTVAGGVSLQSPRSSIGGHGDILSALVLAVSQRAGQKSAEGLPERKITVEEAIRKQTDAAWAKHERRRLDALADQAEAEEMAFGTVDEGNPWG
jgi:hypothetical protein